MILPEVDIDRILFQEARLPEQVFKLNGPYIAGSFEELEAPGPIWDDLRGLARQTGDGTGIMLSLQPDAHLAQRLGINDIVTTLGPLDWWPQVHRFLCYNSEDPKTSFSLQSMLDRVLVCDSDLSWAIYGEREVGIYVAALPSTAKLTPSGWNGRPLVDVARYNGTSYNSVNNAQTVIQRYNLDGLSQ